MQSKVRTHVGGPQIDYFRHGERCEAVNLECSNNGEPFGSIFSRWYFAKFEWTEISDNSDKLIVDAKDNC